MSVISLPPLNMYRHNTRKITDILEHKLYNTMKQVSCISFFQHDHFMGKIKGFGMMQFAHKHLQGIKGLTFYKLMGSGKGNGFNPLPDWGTYSLLTVWESEEDADTFISDSTLYKKYNAYCDDIYTIFMHNLSAHGMWSGQKPFQAIGQKIDPSNEVICAITRARIKTKYLRKFWSYVPTSSKPINNNPDLLFTKGIGEIPIVQMATFSVWKNLDALKAYAYKSPEHSKAIQMTRALKWYKEELFSRFIPFKTLGKYRGEDPISIVSNDFNSTNQ